MSETMSAVVEGSPLWERLHAIGGKVEEEELRYSLSRRGMKLHREHLEELIEKGLVERVGRDLQAVVPVRRDRRGQDPVDPDEPRRTWADEEILDRVKLWSLIVGKPPTLASWNPGQIRRNLPALEDRVEAWYEIMALFEHGDWPSETTVREHFGSLNAALVTAGFEARMTGRQPVEPDSPRPVRKPKYGAEVLVALNNSVAEARREHAAHPTQWTRKKLREALYDQAVAAFTEADRL